MRARTIDGKAIARGIEDRLAARVKGLADRAGRTPHLVAVLVGSDPASQVYLKRKAEAAARVGVRATTKSLPATTRGADLSAALDALARDPHVDGILLQLPLPQPLRAEDYLGRIPPEKDVDAFHPNNAGHALQGTARLLPCTPQGVVEILDHEQVRLEGAHVVIVNHSTVVGRPLALLLLARNATVTVCHKYTQDLAALTRQADVLVTATGVPGLIGREHVRPGAVVIDVGIARGKDGRVVGDVRWDEVQQVASAVTPVPGGVGPLTVAMLMRNVVTAFEARIGGPR